MENNSKNYHRFHIYSLAKDCQKLIAISKYARFRHVLDQKYHFHFSSKNFKFFTQFKSVAIFILILLFHRRLHSGLQTIFLYLFYYGEHIYHQKKRKQTADKR